MTFDPALAAQLVRVAVVRALRAQVLGAGVPLQRVGGACGHAVGGVTQLVHGVLEGQRLQAALLAEGGVQRAPCLRRALRLPLFGRGFGLVRRRLRRDRVGMGVRYRGRGVSDGGLGAHPAEAGRGLVMRRGSRGAMEALRVLQVHQGHAAPVGQNHLRLLLVREAPVGGAKLLSQQGALQPNVALHPVAARRLKAADLAAAEGSDRFFQNKINI